MRKRRALDLNRPQDAKAYVLAWVDKDSLKYEEPTMLLSDDDEDFLLVAKQLFLYCDTRPAAGGEH